MVAILLIKLCMQILCFISNLDIKKVSLTTQWKICEKECFKVHHFYINTKISSIFHIKPSCWVFRYQISYFCNHRRFLYLLSCHLISCLYFFNVFYNVFILQAFYKWYCHTIPYVFWQELFPFSRKLTISWNIALVHESVFLIILAWSAFLLYPVFLKNISNPIWKIFCLRNY